MAHAATPDQRWGDSHGRDARSPKDIPKRGWRDILLRVKDRIKRDRLSIIAAGVAFYALLAVFPALAALVAIFGLVASPEEVEQQLATLGGVLPPEAAEVLLGQVHDLTSTDSTALGIGAIGGLLLALWSASAGIRTLMEALNVAYNEEEKRGTIKLYGTALLLTLAAILGTLVSIAVVVALPVIIKFLGLGSLVEGVVAFGRWPILALMLVLGLALMYRYGPSHASPRRAWVSWGAVIATALCVAGSALFSFYVTRFGSYNETYGAMGAIVILLTWFLLSSYAVLIGAEINAEMERQTRNERPQAKLA